LRRAPLGLRAGGVGKPAGARTGRVLPSSGLCNWYRAHARGCMGVIRQGKRSCGEISGGSQRARNCSPPCSAARPTKRRHESGCGVAQAELNKRTSARRSGLDGASGTWSLPYLALSRGPTCCWLKRFWARPGRTSCGPTFWATEVGGTVPFHCCRINRGKKQITRIK